MYLLSLFTLLSLLTVFTNALKITYPDSDSTIDVSQSWTITWTSNSSDPSPLRFNLAKYGANPDDSYHFLMDDVNTIDNELTVPANSVASLFNNDSSADDGINYHLLGWAVVVDTDYPNGTVNDFVTQSGFFNFILSGNATSGSNTTATGTGTETGAGTSSTGTPTSSPTSLSTRPSTSSTSSLSTSSSSGIAVPTGPSKANVMVAAVMGGAAVAAAALL